MRWPCHRSTACRLFTAAMSELALLSAMLDRAAAGTGGARIVRGEAGIGKSTLLEAVVERARARAMTVHSTRGVQSEAHLPFAGLHQLLAAAPAEARRARRGPAAAPARRVRARGSGSPPTRSGSRSPPSSCSPMRPSDAPLLLVADDAQLLDRPRSTCSRSWRGGWPPTRSWRCSASAARRSPARASRSCRSRRWTPRRPRRCCGSTRRTCRRVRRARPARGGRQPAGARGASGGDAIDRRGRRAAAGPAAADRAPGARVCVPRGGAARRDPHAAAGGGDRPVVRAAGAACRRPAASSATGCRSRRSTPPPRRGWSRSTPLRTCTSGTR